MSRRAGEALRARRPVHDPAMRLICFPWAGAGALGYASWELPEELATEVWAVQLPGRENRVGQPPLRRITAMVDMLLPALKPLMDRPFAFFGHSMGALLAFELARALRRAGEPVPEHVFLSGMRAPDLPPWRPAASVLDDESLLRRLDEMAGPSESAVRDRELLLWLAPTIRADLEACETHRHLDEPPLDVPLTLLTAVDDVEVRVDEVAGWWRHGTAVGPPRVFEGGHLYLLDRRREVLDLVTAELAAATSG
ncbi:thioesterase II family protein [Streptomyces sp. NPDC059604]|uniref:thioesterase II family protein n=2 Tax=unclassified Streptomyces TaxID=2593676 RepID=UPI0036768C6D